MYAAFKKQKDYLFIAYLGLCILIISNIQS